MRNSTLAIVGSSLPARLPSGTPITYEFTIASPKLIVSNVKNNSNGNLNIPTIHTIGVSKFVSNSISFRNTIYISDLYAGLKKLDNIAQFKQKMSVLVIQKETA